MPRPSKQPRVQIKKTTPARSLEREQTRNTIDRLFGGLGAIEYRLSKGEYVSGKDLAKAIDETPSEVLSDPVREYLCRLLPGQIKKRPGPKKPPLDKLIHEIAAVAIYNHEFPRIRAERKAQGRPKIKPKRTPQQEACWIIKNSMKYFRPMSLRRIANIISAQKSR